jgi:hypothetical protein
MLATKVNIAITDMNFARKITSKHLFFAKLTLKPAAKQLSASFLSRVNFVHSFPTMFIKRNISLFHSTYITKTVNNQTSLTLNMQPALNQQVLNQWNRHVQTILMSPSNATEKKFAGDISIAQNLSQTMSKAPSFFSADRFILEKQQAPARLLPTAIVRKTLHIDYLKTAGSSTINPQASSKVLSLKRKKALSEKLRLFSQKIIANHVSFREESRSVGELLTLKASDSIMAEAFQKQRQPPRFDGYELVPKEHFISVQSQIGRSKIKQAGDEEPMLPKTQQKIVAPDVNVLADKVYQLIERKARIERERRG